MKSKKEIRASVRALLKELSPQERERQSKLISKHILSMNEVNSAKVVALFVSMPDEPDTSALLSALSGKCSVVVPRIGGDEMEFFDYNAEALSAGSYGIREPIGDTPVAPSEIDFMVVPGVAFTADGSRMGRGKGFYDKYMSREGFRAYKVGICLTPQIVDELPCEPHDIKMDIVISA